MKNKVHYKLHKVKKQWVTIAVSSLALATVLVGAGQANAEEIQDQTAPLATENVATPDEQATSAEVATTDEDTSNEDAAFLSDQDLERPVDGQGQTGGQFKEEDGNWYYVNQEGQKLTGWQTVDYYQLFFYPDGTQAKDAFVILDGDTYYFQKDNGQMAKNTFKEDEDGNWYYFDKDGRAVTGAQTIDSFDLYFHQDGQQAKGEIITLDGKAYYYDQDNGRKVTNTTIELDGKTYTADSDGVLTEQVAEPTTITGGHFQADDQGNWYYYTAQGDKLTGFQNVDGLNLYFDADGKQAKGGPKTIDGKVYYFDEHSGALQTNQWVSWKVGYGERWATFIGTVHGYLTADGSLATGWQTIDGQDYYFNEKGQRIENNVETIDGKRYLFNDQGQLVKNGSFTIARDSWVGTLKFTYTTDENGVVIAENN